MVARLGLPPCHCDVGVAAAAPGSVRAGRAHGVDAVSVLCVAAARTVLRPLRAFSIPAQEAELRICNIGVLRLRRLGVVRGVAGRGLWPCRWSMRSELLASVLRPLANLSGPDASRSRIVRGSIPAASNFWSFLTCCLVLSAKAQSCGCLALSRLTSPACTLCDVGLGLGSYGGAAPRTEGSTASWICDPCSSTKI